MERWQIPRQSGGVENNTPKDRGRQQISRKEKQDGTWTTTTPKPQRAGEPPKDRWTELEMDKDFDEWTKTDPDRNTQKGTAW